MPRVLSLHEDQHCRHGVAHDACSHDGDGAADQVDAAQTDPDQPPAEQRAATHVLTGAPESEARRLDRRE